MSEKVALTKTTDDYLGFIQSALNKTEVEIRLKCEDNVDLEFNVQFVIRSSPCAKEFIVDKQRFTQMSNLLAFYFDEAYKIPEGYHYDQILYFKSSIQKFSCKDHYGVELFKFLNPNKGMEFHNVTTYVEPNSTIKNKNKISKRQAYPGLNGESIDGGAKESLTTWHPVQRLPMDAIYLLILRITVIKFPQNEETAAHNIEAEVQWRGPHGYLSAIDYPLLLFYGFMCFLYIILATSWFIICLKYWKDLLRIQFWIGAVILIGMIEKAVFYAEYSNMNSSGRSIEGLLELAEMTSCLKRTMAHVLIIIVSVGFGVIKPRLGSTLNQVTAIGIVYFLFCALEGLTRVSKQSTEAMREKQAAKLPLALLEIVIAWWIFSSLVNTMRALRLRRNEIKLSLYRNFTNVLGIALIIAVIYMLWSLYMHIVQYCMKDWRELWIDAAFWHVFFCSILIMIMILWRPSQNNQRYAFTPLLDNSENDDTDDELFNSSQAGVYEMLKQRTQPPNSPKQNREVDEDIKWIENNIPSSLAEALMDEEDERLLKELEVSKML